MASTRPIAPRFLRYAVAVAVAGAFVILLASPVDPGGGATSTVFGLPVTTCLHRLAYAGFAVTLCDARLAADGRALLVAAGIATAYGGMVEFLQGAVPHRTADALDALINAVGACAGAVIWYRIAPWLVRDAAADPSPGGETR